MRFSKKFKVILPWLFLFSLVFLVFKQWFGFLELSAGDAAFYFSTTLKDLPRFPLLWNSFQLGETSTLMGAFLFLNLPVAILYIFNLPWQITERIIWYWPFLILSIFSSWFLIKTILPEIRFKFLAPIIYLLNSYILMIIGGGQISIALAYALFPLVFSLFVRIDQNPNFKFKVVAGLIAALELAIEPRITVLTIGIAFLYIVFSYRLKIQKYIEIFFVPAVIVLGIHFYWIFPALLLRREAYASGFSSSDWVGFLSFSQFSNSLSLLHPNWPENIFGKVYFMRPEFLVIPILAFSSLLFIRVKTKSDKNILSDNGKILFFSFLALTGVFLSKGTNPPLGEVYLWLFNHLPVMNTFRDPTKFYVLIAISYSILISYSVSKMYEFIKKKETKKSRHTLAIFFVLCVLGYWAVLVRPAWSSQLSGTFKGKEFSKEYLELENFISSQPDFFRTFWVPRKQRFGFYDDNHPSLYAERFVSPDVCELPLCLLADQNKKPKEVDPLSASETEILDSVRKYSLSYFKNPQAPDVLSQMGVKYVIVPYDSEEEIFLMDRKYNENEREKYVAFLNDITWLKKIKLNDKIDIYETSEHKDHFFTTGDSTLDIKWKMINPTKYIVNIKSVNEPFDLVFSETYDSLWQAKIGNEIVASKKIYDLFNGFHINKSGDFDIMVEFSGQKYVWWGGTISLLTLTASIFLLLRKKQ